MLRMMASRSSPWTFSRLLTNNRRKDLHVSVELLQLLVFGCRGAQRCLDVIGVFDAHGDYAQCVVWMLPDVLQHEFDDALHFRTDDTAAARRGGASTQPARLR